MDDFLKSSSSTAEAIHIIESITELLKRGGFNLGKWMSNDEKVMEKIPREMKTEVMKDGSADVEERVLGQRYDPIKDNFVFRVNFESRGHKKGVQTSQELV